jgi:hypothetical protein
LLASLSPNSWIQDSLLPYFHLTHGHPFLSRLRADVEAKALGRRVDFAKIQRDPVNKYFWRIEFRFLANETRRESGPENDGDCDLQPIRGVSVVEPANGSKEEMDRKVECTF